jgi:small GTP-binding protein
MGKQEPERARGRPKSKSPLQQEGEQDASFTEIGGSPVPGFILRQILRGHRGAIGRCRWSPNGRLLASPSFDKTIRIWNVDTGESIVTLCGHTDWVFSVAWSPDGKQIASGSRDTKILLWDAQSGEQLGTLQGNAGSVFQLAWTAGHRLISCGSEDKTQVWNPETGALIRTFPQGWSMAVSPKGSAVAISANYQDKGRYLHDSLVRLYDLETGELIEQLTGFEDWGADLAWSSDGQLLAVATGHDSPRINIWDFETGKVEISLEGHTDIIRDVDFSADGRLLASKSRDGTVRVWLRDSWRLLTVLPEPINEQGEGGSDAKGLAFNPISNTLATLGDNDTVIRVWDIAASTALNGDSARDSVHYTTAKLVLVGDSGVGKTGLGWRLAHGEFKEHSSTHGQQFWPIQQLGLKRKDGTECEAVLWDLAGQHVYRQIHSIFLENVTAALVLFDPSNRQEPLKGVQFWLEQLKGKGQLPPTVLIGARVDRGAPAMSQQELDQFCQRYGIKGGYISTSAMKGDGLEALLGMLKKQIPWDEMTATVTTVTFKRIKDFVLGLKEKPDRKGVLVNPVELREQLQEIDPDWSFTDAEMMTAVGHLETHGYVTILRSSAGEQHILLTPELLATLAASIVLLADKHERELGAVNETELLQGKYPFDELAGLSPVESQILLDAAILRFLQHNICFRETLRDETFRSETLLIFPALIKQRRPLQDELPAADDISYVVRGRIENLYASLVVLLGYTPSFKRINQWQNQAQYEMDEGEICGFRLIQDREGEIELVIYYGDQMPSAGRAKYQELFEQFLYQRDVEVTPFPPVVCPKGHRQERTTVIKRVREGKGFVHCEECGAKTDLPELDQSQTIGIGASPWLQREEAAARLRSAYEVHLTKIKSYRRNWAVPRCYVSCVAEQSEWARELIKDLCDAGVLVVEPASQVQPDDFVVVLDTPAYQKAFQKRMLAGDAPLIQARLDKKRLLISLALTGHAGAHEFKSCIAGSFSDETHYPVSLFDLVLNLYAIPLNHAGFASLRQALHAQWEQTLAGKKDAKLNSPLKIFISYSHQDETFKDELVTMLKALQRRGIVDTWEDRLIEGGDEWNKSIQEAMDDCDLALLLVSSDYLASRFIQEHEQPKLLRRREEMKVRVVPVIVRPCPWQSEPILKDLQALPRDNKAIITFPKDTGARDQAWADIATVIEKHAEEANR